MITYAQIQDDAVRLKTLTTLTPTEFEWLVPIFRRAYLTVYPAHLTQTGQPRCRRAGGGRKGALPTWEDKLLFGLHYHKNYPTQGVLAVEYGLSQSQVCDWIHRLLPLIQLTLRRAKQAPNRSGRLSRTGATNRPPELLVDGTDRRRRRPKNKAKQLAHYTGKKKTHTDRNVLLGNRHTRRIESLSPTTPGATPEKRIIETQPIRYPLGTILYKDLAYLAYEPPRTHGVMPKRTPRGKWLGTADRLGNRLKAQVRVTVEHCMAGLKRARCVTEVFRNLKPGFSDMVMEIACGLHNLRTMFRSQVQ